MAYTEIKEQNGRKYYYRVRSIRKGRKFRKERIYLGKNLLNEVLILKEREADKKLNMEKQERKLKKLNKILPEIIKILKKNNVKKAGIFGSYARGDEKKDSDIDIIIEPPKGIGFGFAGIELELEKNLRKKVDLVTYKYLSPYLEESILKSEIRII